MGIIASKTVLIPQQTPNHPDLWGILQFHKLQVRDQYNLPYRKGYVIEDITGFKRLSGCPPSVTSLSNNPNGGGKVNESDGTVIDNIGIAVPINTGSATAPWYSVNQKVWLAEPFANGPKKKQLQPLAGFTLTIYRNKTERN